ncbi:MAG: NDP-sugar synthase [Chloroflexales bacterium]|nr:NDP-sugar synthase [Chloroflexales bacterium]
MDAVILVGGLGTRLRPLTCNRPKPLLPLANRPFIERVLLSLRDQGVRRAILAVQYLGEQFRAALGDGERLGIAVQIADEPEPRGTAGAVRHLAHTLRGTTVVLNGDSLHDLDLRAMIQSHRARAALATIALTPVADPSAFGLVETDAAGRVRRFVEKPRPDQITTNLINAGTYILEPAALELIPPDSYQMFERDLFPELLRRAAPVYGFPSDAYFTDIGRPAAYLQVHHDLLLGRTRFTPPGREIMPGVWAEGDVAIHPTALLGGPIVLGRGVRIGPHARLVGPTVVGAGCVLAENAVVERAVLWAGCRLAAGASVLDAVLGANCQIGERTSVEQGAVLGDGCIIGDDNHLSRGVKLWPGVTLGDEAIRF